MPGIVFDTQHTMRHPFIDRYRKQYLAMEEAKRATAESPYTRRYRKRYLTGMVAGERATAESPYTLGCRKQYLAMREGCKGNRRESVPGHSRVSKTIPSNERGAKHDAGYPLQRRYRKRYPAMVEEAKRATEESHHTRRYRKRYPAMEEAKRVTAESPYTRRYRKRYPSYLGGIHTPSQVSKTIPSKSGGRATIEKIKN